MRFGETHGLYPLRPRWCSTKGFALAWYSKEHGLALFKGGGWQSDFRESQATTVGSPDILGTHPPEPISRVVLHRYGRPSKGRGWIRPLGSSESFSRSYPAVSTKGSFWPNRRGPSSLSQDGGGHSTLRRVSQDLQPHLIQGHACRHGY